MASHLQRCQAPFDRDLLKRTSCLSVAQVGPSLANPWLANCPGTLIGILPLRQFL